MNLLRFAIFTILVVGTTAQCKVCLNGGAPANPSAVVVNGGGFTCKYFYDNAFALRPEGQQCMAVQTPQNQAICGCGTGSKVPTRKPTSRAPTRKPTTKVPTRKPTTKAPTRKPTTRAPTRKPTTKAPTRKPTTRAPTRSQPSRGSPSAGPPVSTKCNVCLNGGPPGNPNAILGSGIYCLYYYTNAALLTPNDCSYIHLPTNQATCGCSSSATATTTKAPTRAPTPKPPTRAPTRLQPSRSSPSAGPPVSTKCNMCLNGGSPGNPSAILGSGIYCLYYYTNADYLTPNDCSYIHLPTNQATCGCS